MKLFASLRTDAKAGTFANKGLGTKCGRGWVGIRGNCRRSTGKQRNKQGEIIPEKNPSSRTKEEAMGKKGLTVAQKAKAIVMAAKMREEKGFGPLKPVETTSFNTGRSVKLNKKQDESMRSAFARFDREGTEAFLDTTGIQPRLITYQKRGRRLKEYAVAESGDYGAAKSPSLPQDTDRFIKSLRDRARLQDSSFFATNKTASQSIEAEASRLRAEMEAAKREAARTAEKPTETADQKKEKMTALRQGLKGRKGTAKIAFGGKTFEGPATIYGDTIAIHKTIGRSSGEFGKTDRSQMDYTVTHLPSGLKVGQANTLNGAKAITGAAIRSGLAKSTEPSKMAAFGLNLEEVIYATENHYYA